MAFLGSAGVFMVTMRNLPPPERCPGGIENAVNASCGGVYFSPIVSGVLAYNSPRVRVIIVVFGVC